MVISVFLTYSFLTLAIISLWLPKKQIWFSLTSVLSISMGIFSGVLDWRSLPMLAVFAGLLMVQTKAKQLLLRILIYFCVVVMAVMLVKHALPGFHNFKVIERLSFSPDSIPFSMYLNYDKVFMGLLLSYWFIPFDKKNVQLGLLVKHWGGISLILLPIMFLGSHLFGYVKFDPKIPACSWIWVFNNLFFVCFAEEALFRGYIQGVIFRNTTTGLIVAAVLFGLAHFQGGFKYVLLATFAGIFYGLAYKRTGRLETAILTHFGLNTLHFFFFSYPALIPK